jgi:hypothetical protein
MNQTAWKVAFRIVAALPLLSGAIPASRASADEREFNKVAPLLAEHCLACHVGKKAKSGLDFSTAKSALQGSDGGPVIVAGNPEESLLIERIANGSMPPEDDGRRLTKPEVQAFQDWIKAGAPWPADRVLKAKRKNP